MNEAEVGRVADELGRLVGIPFGNLWQPSRDRVVLGLADGTLLAMVPRGPGARFHTVASRPANPPRPFSFQGACRAHLHGPLSAVRKVPGERVVQFEFGAARLELRLTGRSGGLWLVVGDRVVAAYDGPAPDALPALPPHPPRPDPPRFEPGPDGSWDLAARGWFEAAERERERAERLGRLAVALDRAIGHHRRLLGNLEEDLLKAEEAPALRHRADLLAANLHRAARGATELWVDDWEGGNVRLELDPSRPASVTLDALYRKAKRLERVAERVLERMDTVEAELRAWTGARDRLDALPDDALERLERSLPRVRHRPRAAPSTLPYLTWVGPRGERVLVGRNEAGNRRLTFQVAKGWDWWMHLRGRPGAHVVIPVSKDASPPLELLLAAAQIAMATGKVEVGEAAEVQYTRVRDVRAIPGEVGTVTVGNEKVLRVVREDAGLVGWTVQE